MTASVNLCDTKLQYGAAHYTSVKIRDYAERHKLGAAPRTVKARSDCES